MRRRTLALSFLIGALGALFLAPVARAQSDPDEVSGAEIRSAATDQQFREALADFSADGTGPHQIDILGSFEISNNGTPTYTGTEPLTIAGNGFTIGGPFSGMAMLDHATAAALTIEDLVVSGFESSTAGGGITSAAGLTTITGSTFLENGAQVGDGGAVYATGDLVVRTSTFTNNSTSGSGGALAVAGAADVVVSGSTFNGGVAEVDGSAVATDEGSITMVNSTLTQVQGHSVLYADGGTIDLTYVTMVQNGPANGPPGAAVLSPLGQLRLFGTVIMLSDQPSCAEQGSTVSSYSYADDSSCGLTGTGDVQNGSPVDISPLASNGGPTQTMAIDTTPGLYDAIPAAACGSVAVDQRGEPRPGDLSAGCDIGAFELQAGDSSGPLPTPEPEPLTPVDPAGGPIAGRPGFTG